MKKRVAIQGYQGAFHQEAVESYWPQGAELVECATFEQLVQSVVKGKAHYGVMAVENSLVGCILPNFLLIRESGLSVIGEVYLRITQNLMALPGETLSSLRRVESHYMAVAQCKDFLGSNQHLSVVESIDTALSARNIAQHSLRGVGAIGSMAAANLYGLDVIAPSIETNKENFTRFLVLNPINQPSASDVAVKTTIAFALKHQPGSLAGVLNHIADSGANLTMLQSLPMVGHAWEYIFHADICFGTMEQAKRMLSRLSLSLPSLWVMGVYPQAEMAMQGSSVESSKTQNHEC